MAHGGWAPADLIGRARGSACPRCHSRASQRVCVCSLAVLVWSALSLACAAPPPDLVLLNGRVFTADPDRPWAEALAIRGGRITGVGSTAEVSALAGASTVRRDLAGRTVLPGLNDAHVTDPALPAQDLRGFFQAALASGVTSMQWFVGERTVREAGDALVQASTEVRVRMGLRHRGSARHRAGERPRAGGLRHGRRADRSPRDLGDEAAARRTRRRWRRSARAPPPGPGYGRGAAS